MKTELLNKLLDVVKDINEQSAALGVASEMADAWNKFREAVLPFKMEGEGELAALQRLLHEREVLSVHNTEYHKIRGVLIDFMLSYQKNPYEVCCRIIAELKQWRTIAPAGMSPVEAQRHFAGMEGDKNRGNGVLQEIRKATNAHHSQNLLKVVEAIQKQNKEQKLLIRQLTGSK